jgi:DNA-directed RNA polymerase specialized sigma24 family protein
VSTIPLTDAHRSAVAAAPGHAGCGAAHREQQLAEQAERLRRPLLAAHHHAARREDLEDLYAQAVLELLLRLRRDASRREPAHVANALRQKFQSRIVDRQRALGGRSPDAHALATAVPLDDAVNCDRAHADVAGEVILREQLGETVLAFSALPDRHREALRCELAGLSPARACAMHGWREENYRKLRQRARQKLREISRAA